MADLRGDVTQLLRIAVVTMTAAALGTVGVAQAAPGPATPAAGVSEAFYQPPNPLPAGSPGDLIRTETFPVAITVPTVWGKVPAKGTRLLYRSTDANGQPVAVSGYYLEPTRAWTGPGPRPIIDYAGGLHGQGDSCAASKMLQSGVEFFGPGGPRAEIERLATYNMLAKGYGVVSSDYIGGGTPGTHTFAVRVDQANAVLDAGRAVLKLPQVAPGTKIGIAGYSQGGAAAAAAAELATSYAPDLPLVGIYAGGAPTDLRALLDHLDGGRLGGIIGYALNGVLARYPDVDTKVEPLLNANGRATLKQISTECIAATAVRFPKSSEWTASGKTIGQIIDATPEFQRVIDDQDVGNAKPSVPTFLSGNPDDPTVPIAVSRELHRKWCAQNPASLKYDEIPFPVRFIGGSPVGHVAGGVSGLTRALDWLKDRFAGTPAPTGCYS
ncbi:triacylglycerol lipase [Williamsia phyllosphaerae]|uniref:Triacylglycerol lipase n=2 Tax=Williamsia phyllosphaerae TaxID=885042 RepID=A0ABQ1UA90_9NOCA|nr:triacylglycerol lipase [Williamsia phyllosphaerae]